MTIYIDIYFLKNVIFNFLLLYLTSLIIRKKFKICRGVLASCIGGIYAICALYAIDIFKSSFLKIFISILMLFVTFGSKEMLIIMSSFFSLNYLVSGIIASLLKVDSQIILVTFAIFMIFILYIYKQNQKHNDLYEICIGIFENEIELIAKLDTGNELKESIFGDNVIIVSEEKIKNKLDEEVIKILNNEKLEISDKYKNKIRLISFKTISNDGLKIGIKLDRILINKDDKNIESKAIMILSKNRFRNYDALIGINLLEGGFECEDNCFDKIKNKGII